MFRYKMHYPDGSEADGGACNSLIALSRGIVEGRGCRWLHVANVRWTNRGVAARPLCASRTSRSRVCGGLRCGLLVE